MANTVTVELVASANKFKSGLAGADSALSSFGSKAKEHFGGIAKTAALAAGAAGIGAVGAVLKTGYGEVSDYQKGLAQLQAGLRSTHNAAGISAQGMEDLASNIQDYSGQTDDSIVATEQLLLTFTNVRNQAGKNNDVFTQTTKIAADMAARLGGDASGAAIQLGKALNDPVQGITALTRVGVSFTDGQKKQIAAMVKSGNTLGAQKVILGELNKEFGGSAKAVGQTLPGQVARAKRAFEDFSQGIVTAMLPAVTGFVNFFVDKALPGLTRFGDYLSRTLGPVFTFIGDAVHAFTDGLHGGPWEDSPKLFELMSQAGLRLRAAFQAISAAVKNFGAALVPIFRNDIIPAVRAMVDVFVNKVLPVYQAVWTFIYTKLVPAVIAIVTAVAQRLQPVFRALSGFITGTVLPIVQQLAAKIKEWLPTLENIAQKVLLVVGTLLKWAATILSVVLPPLIALIGVILRNVVPVLLGLVGVVIHMVGGIVNAISALSAAWGRIWNAIGAAVGFVYRYYIAPQVGAIKAVIGGVSTAIGAVWTFWATAWHYIGAIVQNAWDFIRPIVDTIKNAIKDVSGAVGTVTGAVGKAGGFLGGLNPFAAGGFVDGPFGSPQPILAHGGEMILNPNQQAAVRALGMSGGGGGSGDLHIHIDGRSELVLKDFRRMKARGVNLGIA